MRKPALLAILPATIVLLTACEPGKSVTKTEVVNAHDLIVLDGPRAAEVLASDPAITIIDIRTPEEFAGGHIKGALNIDFTGDDFEVKISELDRDKPYLLHCASGNRSGKSLPVFEKLNFTRLYHLDTGFNGWVADGQPVEK